MINSAILKLPLTLTNAVFDLNGLSLYISDADIVETAGNITESALTLSESAGTLTDSPGTLVDAAATIITSTVTLNFPL